MHLLIWRTVIILQVISCVILSIISVSTHSWVYTTDRYEHRGLWKVCSHEGCLDIEKQINIPGWLYMVRALTCLSIILYIVIIVYFLSICMFVIHWNHNFIASTLILISGLFMFIALGLYTRNINIRNSKWGWSYMVGWVGFFYSLLTFCIAFVYSRMVSKEARKFIENYVEEQQALEDMREEEEEYDERAIAV